MAEAKGAGGLAARLKKARATAEVLAKKTDALNESLMKAQDAIRNLGLGVVASQYLHKGEKGGEVSLSFERFGGKWCLTIVQIDPNTKVHTTTPLLQTSREMRLAASRRLPDLVDRLIEQTQRDIAAVDESITHVEKFVIDLKEAQS